MYRTRTRTFASVATLSLSVLVLVLAPGVASAAPQGSTPLDDGFEDTVDDWCGVTGLSVDVVSTLTGWETVKKNDKYVSHGVIDETYTANGVTLSAHSKVVDKDVQVVDPGDGTLLITVLQTGNATIYGADGMAIARNPGQFRFLLTLDADTGEELDVEVLKESTGRSDDACAAMVAAFTA